jgi:hypothetical protein
MALTDDDKRWIEDLMEKKLEGIKADLTREKKAKPRKTSPSRSSTRRSIKTEPIDVDELAGMSNMKGMLSFLKTPPEENARRFSQRKKEIEEFQSAWTSTADLEETLKLMFPDGRWD